MKKLMIIASLMFFVISSNAYALSISAEGGAYFPKGDYGKTFGVGYLYGLSAWQKIFPFTSLKASYYRYHSNGKDDSLGGLGSLLSNKVSLDGDAVELLLRISPFDLMVEPYIAAGGGYYMNKVKSDAYKYDQNGFGYVIEAGIGVTFAIVTIGVNARYFNNDVSGSGIKSKNEGYTAGLSLALKIPFI